MVSVQSAGRYFFFFLFFFLNHGTRAFFSFFFLLFLSLSLALSLLLQPFPSPLFTVTQPADTCLQPLLFLDWICDNIYRSTCRAYPPLKSPPGPSPSPRNVSAMRNFEENISRPLGVMMAPSPIWRSTTPSVWPRTVHGSNSLSTRN